jgi:membrane protein
MLSWLDRAQRRNRALGFVVAVVYKYFDDQSGYLAALITYYAFVSLFPVLLLSTTVLGVVLVGHPQLQQQIMHSALSQFPIIGEQLGEPRRLSGGMTGVIVGVAGAVYGSLGVGQALQNAMDTAWAVPRHKRPDAVTSRIRSLTVVALMGMAAITATILSGLGRVLDTLGWWGQAAFVLAAVAINMGICLVAFRVTTVRELTVRQVWPGAAVAAVLWQILQSVGASYVAHTVKSASAINSVFALVLGLLAFLFLLASSWVLCAQINVVRVDHLYPRALLSMFTDDASLTTADRKTYAKQAQAQQVKTAEHIQVKFTQPSSRADDGDGSTPAEDAGTTSRGGGADPGR